MINADILTPGIGPDILINVLKDCIIFVVWAARIFSNFYLKQKQRHSVWSFTENAVFISFHGRILSRYSAINTFKTSKDLIFQKYQKQSKKTGLKGNCKYKEAAIIYSLNTEAVKQNEP